MLSIRHYIGLVRAVCWITTIRQIQVISEVREDNTSRKNSTIQTLVSIWVVKVMVNKNIHYRTVLVRIG